MFQFRRLTLNLFLLTNVSFPLISAPASAGNSSAVCYCEPSDTTRKQGVLPQDQKESSTIAFGYWNDNFAFQGRLNRMFPGNPITGSDDHVTASFWLQFSRTAARSRTECNVYFHILTNKQAKYRADLLAIFMARKKQYSFGTLRSGIGVISRGNFGGSFIQNHFHDLWIYPRVELPYLQIKTGLLANVLVQPTLFSKFAWRFAGFLEGQYTTNVFPSKTAFGLDARNFFDDSTGKGWHGNIQIGYVYYFHPDKWMSPLFRHGLQWGIFISRNFKFLPEIGVFMTRGQYGMAREFQFGMVFSFMGDKVLSPSLGNIKFP